MAKETEVEQGARDDNNDGQKEAENTETPDQALIETADRDQSVGSSTTTLPESNRPPSLWRMVPLWLVLLTAVVLTMVIWKITVFLRLQRHPGEDSGQGLRPAHAT